MEGTQVRAFKKPCKIGLRGFLESEKGSALKTPPGREVLGNFLDNSLEGASADEEFGALLVPSDFAQGNCSRAVAVFLAGHPGLLCGGFHGEVLARGLPPGGFSRSLFGAGHFRMGGEGAGRKVLGKFWEEGGRAILSSF